MNQAKYPVSDVIYAPRKLLPAHRRHLEKWWPVGDFYSVIPRQPQVSKNLIVCRLRSDYIILVRSKHQIQCKMIQIFQSLPNPN